MVWLPLLIDIFGIICIAIVYDPFCDVVHFKINLSFLIKPFFYRAKKLVLKYKHLKNERKF